MCLFSIFRESICLLFSIITLIDQMYFQLLVKGNICLLIWSSIKQVGTDVPSLCRKMTKLFYVLHFFKAYEYIFYSYSDVGGYIWLCTITFLKLGFVNSVVAFGSSEVIHYVDPKIIDASQTLFCNLTNYWKLFFQMGTESEILKVDWIIYYYTLLTIWLTTLHCSEL